MKTHGAAEITLRVIIISVILTIVLSITNCYVALKVGMLTSASIPAAIISMGILSFFKNPTIFENNLVQTAASSGEAIAGGIVFSIPALIMIGYWDHFPFWQNFFISACGGILGVIFSVPLRKLLVHDDTLRFPEARAITAILKSTHENRINLKGLVLGGFLGALIELCQTGFKIIASSMQLWFNAGRLIFGFNAGFSAAMVGAGYLMGTYIAISILIGAIVGWIIGVPFLSEIYSPILNGNQVDEIVANFFADKIRYLGIGAMIITGLWSVGRLIKPLLYTLNRFMTLKSQRDFKKEKDLPLKFTLPLLILILIVIGFLFLNIFPLAELGFTNSNSLIFVSAIAVFILILGFLGSAVAAYFSGLVGVGASPGSAILIATFALSTIFISLFIDMMGNQSSQTLEALIIIISTTAFGAAAIANDNMQDLKVGSMIGATPWKQQMMLILGTLIASAVTPLVMQLLFNSYGIGKVLPHPGMSIENTLAAPPAQAIASLTEAIFKGEIPWNLMAYGGLIGIFFILLTFKWQELSPLAMAIGIYLPLTTSTPLIFGGLIAAYIERRLRKKELHYPKEKIAFLSQRNVLIACGLVAGAAIMDVILSIPIALLHNPESLQIHFPHLELAAKLLGVGAILLIGYILLKMPKIKV